jgi:hypothetical protein
MNTASMHSPTAYYTAVQHSAPARCGGFSIQLKFPSCNVRKLGSVAMTVNTYFFVKFCELLEPLLRCCSHRSNEMRSALFLRTMKAFL